MCVELQRVNFDPKNQSWSFWSHNHETSMKMWKRALIFGRELALQRASTPKNESWSFWSHKHETSIKMWKRALKKRACPSNVKFDLKNKGCHETMTVKCDQEVDLTNCRESNVCRVATRELRPQEPKLVVLVA